MIVYFHRDITTCEIFYVGIASEVGRKQRPYKKDNRNNYWKNYVNKHGGFIVQIVHTGLSKESACEWERWYIKILGKKIEGGQLVNIADGGESNEGYKQSAWHRKLSSDRAKRLGTAHMMTKECRKKAAMNISKALAGKLVGKKNPNYGNKWTPEMKAALSIKRTGVKMNEKTKASKWFKSLLAKKSFVYDKNNLCSHLSITCAAKFYGVSGGYMSSMISGNRVNKFGLVLYSSGTI